MPYIAVIDVETTGFNPYLNDRIVELAAVVIDLNGTQHREFSTLLNPERDIGPTRVHGLSSGDVISAPKFEEIAGMLVEFFSGCVAVAGHNVRFDRSFLNSEFARIGYNLEELPSLCSMQLAGGGSLSTLCAEYGVEYLGDAHEALNDARATARLLTNLLNDAPQFCSELAELPLINWPYIQRGPATLLTRAESRVRKSQPPTYIQRLVQRIPGEIPPDEDVSARLAYSALLERVLQDRHIDESEGLALLDLATRWNISPSQIVQIHQEFLLRLTVVALADGKVTESERQDLHNVALLLGIDTANLNSFMDGAEEKLKLTHFQGSSTGIPAGIEGFEGKRICFTGECLCQINGGTITRDLATALAVGRGMVVLESVTKKLDLLVVADPQTQSGKAKKARQYGILVMQETVFWRNIGVEVE
jgi:DNA polymerase III subunit epsilon